MVGQNITTVRSDCNKRTEYWVQTQNRIALAVCVAAVPLLYYCYTSVMLANFKRRAGHFPGAVFPELMDLVPAIYWAAAFLVARIIAYKLLLVPAATVAVKMQPGWDVSQLNQRREKFQHCLFLCFYYAGATAYGWYVLVDKPWVPAAMVPGATGETVNCWRGFWTQTVQPEVLTYYLLSLGYALQSLVYLVCRKHRRDFLEMFLHHSLEISLIAYSYLYGYMRIGTLVLAVHDVGDVFINITRCTNEARYIKSTMVLFAMLLASWVYFRLYLFPVHVISSSLWEGINEIVYRVGDPDGLSGSGYYFFNGMLIALLVLHVFWFFMFLRMIYFFTTQHVVDDAVDQVVNEADAASSPAGDRKSKQS
eukprot:TRINITY_DN17785_c0_g1_i1.p1 TRINITY_DN17785_c0_g1~~TRINITY_DN17785_c0_g1_i1.p1  ORF type:complete len:388 (-),score=116.67 TRINITY_DN17785_c0_g1_i1:50-1144(-)